MKRFTASYVYTLEQPEPLVNAFVETDDSGRVLKTGVCPEGEIADEGIIVPGFVNAHCHLELSHLKGKFAKGTGMAGFIDQINSLRDSSSHEKKLSDIEENLSAMYESGVSAMADISNCDDTFAAKSASPMYTRTFLEVFGTEPEDCDGVMESVKSLNAKAAEFGLDAAPTPHSCYTMSPELLSASSAEALKAGYLSYHSQESPEEEDMVGFGKGALWENRKRAGMSTPPVTGKPSLMYFLDRLAAVHPAPYNEHILLVHNVCLTAEAADAVKAVAKNVYFAVCPLSNIFIHNALPPIPLMREKGLKITVGTDSLSSNDCLSMVAELACLHSNFPDVPMAELLVWACRNGAEFLSKENELGTISVGKKPGIVRLENLGDDGFPIGGTVSVRLI